MSGKDIPILAEQLKVLLKDLEKLINDTKNQKQTAELIHNTFCLIHNIKSDLFLINHNKSLKITYHLEKYFEKLKNGKIRISTDAVSLFISCINWISDDITDKGSSETIYDKLTNELKNMEFSEIESDIESGKVILESDQKSLLRDARNSSLNIFIAEQLISKSLSKKEYYDLPIINYINEIGMIVLKTPAYNSLSEYRKDEEITLKIIFVSDRNMNDLDKTLLPSLAPFEDDLFLNNKEYKILIVEDNSVALLLQRSIMSTYGICDDVSDGESAMDLFKLALEENAPYDIILLDLLMPGIGGAEVLKRIREIEEKCAIKGLDRSKVIISTTTRESSTLMELFRAETDAYIIKPMTKEKIEKELRNLKLIL